MDFLDRFRIDAENQALKYVASKIMFCQSSGCGKILDYRKTVEIEFTSGNSFIMCEDCFLKPETQYILTRAYTQRIIKKINRYQDWNKLRAEEEKKLKAEKAQLKLDLFNSMSKN